MNSKSHGATASALARLALLARLVSPGARCRYFLLPECYFLIFFVLTLASFILFTTFPLELYLPISRQQRARLLVQHVATDAPAYPWVLPKSDVLEAGPERVVLLFRVPLSLGVLVACNLPRSENIPGERVC
jgi:hypothetical protein